MKILFIILLTISYLISAPAFKKMREFKNSDGTVFMAQGQGNHHLNWIKTEDGEILKYNKESKDFEYAEIDTDTLKASGTRYEKNNSRRARSLGRVNKIDETQLYELLKKRQKQRREQK